MQLSFIDRRLSCLGGNDPSGRYSLPPHVTHCVYRLGGNDPRVRYPLPPFPGDSLCAPSLCDVAAVQSPPRRPSVAPLSPSPPPRPAVSGVSVPPLTPLRPPPQSLDYEVVHSDMNIRHQLIVSSYGTVSTWFSRTLACAIIGA